MNRLILLSLFFLTACGSAGVQAQAAPGDTRTPRPTQTAQPPTYTATPSPTIGYEATAHVAQATADAAARLLVEATRAHEAELMEYARMTEQADQVTHQAAVWTATAAPSAIPASQTAMSIANQIAFGKQTQVAAIITATVEAPLIKRRSAEADAQAKLAWIIALAKAILWAGIGVSSVVLMINIGLKIQHEREGIAYWMKYGPKTPATDAKDLAPAAGAFHLDERDGKYASQTRHTIPPSLLTAEQVDAVSDVLRDGKSFSRDNLSHIIGKQKYNDLAAWLVFRQYALRAHPTDDRAGVTLNERGELLFGLRDKLTNHLPI